MKTRFQFDARVRYFNVNTMFQFPVQLVELSFHLRIVSLLMNRPVLVPQRVLFHISVSRGTIYRNVCVKLFRSGRRGEKRERSGPRSSVTRLTTETGPNASSTVQERAAWSARRNIFLSRPGPRVRFWVKRDSKYETLRATLRGGRKRERGEDLNALTPKILITLFCVQDDIFKRVRN